jgi:hypothetical protein
MTAAQLLQCTFWEGTGSASRFLQPMFAAWAETAGVHLSPGTANGCADADIRFPDTFVSLAPFAHLIAEPAGRRRLQPGFAPRLFSAVVNDSVRVWVFRWSADDVRLEFVGSTDRCRADRHVELLATVSFRRDLQLSDGGQFRLAFGPSL